MSLLPPINFKKWIDENRHLLKPPVGNRQIWENREFMVTVVGGPNSRTDFHVNEGEEFFYQVEGDIVLRVMGEGAKLENIPIREGEIFLLPPKIPHSPQRPAGSVGLVLERKRLPHEKDGFMWFCGKCQAKIHEEFLHLRDLVEDLPPVFARYHARFPASGAACPKCGDSL